MVNTITRQLTAWGRDGDDEARLLELLEPELCRFALAASRRRADTKRSLQPEELVSEYWAERRNTEAARQR